MRFRGLTFIAIGLMLIIIGLTASVAYGASRMLKLNRNDVYYEIVNDNGDFGNYFESYWVPLQSGKRVYCVVYSDKIGDGGGAGMSCDWGNQLAR